MNDEIDEIINGLAHQLAANLLPGPNHQAQTTLIREWLEKNTTLRVDIGRYVDRRAQQ